MKKIIVLAIFCCFFTQNGKSQKHSSSNIINCLNKNSGKGFINDSVMIKLQADNDLIIGYSVYNYAWNSLDQYTLLVLKKNKWCGIRYNKKESFEGKTQHNLDTVQITDKQIDSVLSIIEMTKGWTLSFEIGWEGGNCPQVDYNKPVSTFCDPSDGSSMRLVMMSKTNLQTAAFYMPEYIENCCPGWQDRIRFLKIVKAIAAIVK